VEKMDLGTCQIKYNVNATVDEAATRKAKEEAERKAKEESVRKAKEAEQEVGNGEEDKVLDVTDGLVLILRRTNTGYKVLLTNSHPRSKFMVRVNFQDSENLKFARAQGFSINQDTMKGVTTAGAGYAYEGQTISGTVGSGKEQDFVTATMIDRELGKCEIRCNTSVRVV